MSGNFSPLMFSSFIFVWGTKLTIGDTGITRVAKGSLRALLEALDMLQGHSHKINFVDRFWDLGVSIDCLPYCNAFLGFYNRSD